MDDAGGAESADTITDGVGAGGADAESSIDDDDGGAHDVEAFRNISVIL